MFRLRSCSAKCSAKKSALPRHAYVSMRDTRTGRWLGQRTADPAPPCAPRDHAAAGPPRAARWSGCSGNSRLQQHPSVTHMLTRIAQAARAHTPVFCPCTLHGSRHIQLQAQAGARRVTRRPTVAGQALGAPELVAAATGGALTRHVHAACRQRRVSGARAQGRCKRGCGSRCTCHRSAGMPCQSARCAAHCAARSPHLLDGPLAARTRLGVGSDPALRLPAPRNVSGARRERGVTHERTAPPATPARPSAPFPATGSSWCSRTARAARPGSCGGLA